MYIYTGAERRRLGTLHIRLFPEHYFRPNQLNFEMSSLKTLQIKIWVTIPR